MTLVGSFTPEELHELVWSKPVIIAAAELGISDVALQKTCRKHHIPTPPRGWWTKVDHGQAPAPPPLPAGGGYERIVVGIGNKPSPRTAASPAPADASKPRREPRDPFVAYTMARLRGAEWDYRQVIAAHARRAFFVEVGEPSLARVEFILQRLASGVKARGLVLTEGKYGVIAGVPGRWVSIRLVEQKTQAPLSEYARWFLTNEIFNRSPRRKPPRATATSPALNGFPRCNHIPNGRLRMDLKLGKSRGLPIGTSDAQHWIFEDDDQLSLEMVVDDIIAAVASMALGEPRTQAASARS